MCLFSHLTRSHFSTRCHFKIHILSLASLENVPQAAKKPTSSIDEELAKMLASPTLDFSGIGGDDDGDSGAGVGDDFDFNSYIKQAASASSSTSNNLFD